MGKPVNGGGAVVMSNELMINFGMQNLRWIRALLLGVTLLAGPALADDAPPKKASKKEAAAEKGSGKGKAGDACKTNEDCEQNARPQQCRDNRCEERPLHPVT